MEKTILDSYNEEFLSLMNAPANTDLTPPVPDALLSETLMYLVDVAHTARLTYIRLRAAHAGNAD